MIPVTGTNFLTGANQSNSAVEFALLKPWAARGATLTAAKILAAVRPKLLAIPDAIALSFDPPAIPGIATTGGFEFEVEDLTGQGAQALNDATQALLAEARKQPELDARQLFSTFSTSTPEYTYDLDRSKAKLLGLSLPDIFNTLQIELGSLYVNDFTLFGRTFRVTMQAENGARANPTNVSRTLRPQYRRRHGATRHTWEASTDGRTGVRVALQHLWFGADQRRSGSGLQLGAGDRRDATGRGPGPAGRLQL